MMTHTAKALACILGTLVLGTGTNRLLAVDSDNPYQGIVDRNAFNLKPPPPPPDPESLKPPPLKITLTGITTILGNKRALLKTAPPPGKPGEPAKTEQSYILTEGQRDGDIEVLEIDDKAGSVKVNNSGTIMTLTFEKDGPKIASTPAPPGLPGLPGAIPSPTGGMPRSFTPPGGVKPGFPMPSRPLRTDGAAAGMPGLPGVVPGTAGGLSFGSASTVAGSTTTATTQMPQRTPEETVALYEANRLKNQMLQQQGVRLPNLPPHPWSNGDAGAAPQSALPQ